ncbi:MAG: hypothetical protein CXX81_14025 [Methanobacteriota archaeon]|nr:MAG: hypothetical protein CXX81_14025 [Euryarchaeota archaeon]
MATSTVADPRPTEHFFWSIKSGVVESERGVIKQKAGAKVRELREMGVYPSGGPQYFPFARADPLDLMIPLAYRAESKPSEGGLTKTEIGRRIQADTAPHGPSPNWWKKEWERHLERLKKLSPEEYSRWYDFRKKIRELEREYDYDGSGMKEKDGRKGSISWPIKALRRWANGYLAQPWNPTYRMPTEEEVAEYLKNPKEHLSEGDKKLWSKLVSKKAL